MNFITEPVDLLRYINKKDILSVAHEMKWNERSSVWINPKNPKLP